MAEARFKFEPSVLEKARALREGTDESGRKRSWVVVSQILQCPTDSLRATLSRNKNKGSKDRYKRHAAFEQKIEEAISAGHSTALGIARALGKDPILMRYWLKRMGYGYKNIVPGQKGMPG